MSAWNLSEHEWEILQHKRLQLLQQWEFRKNRGFCLPDFLIWGWLVNEGALRSSFSSSQSGAGRFIRKIPSQSLWLLSFLVLQQLLGRFMARWKHQTLLHVETGGSEKDLRLWMNSSDAPHAGESSSSFWVFWFGSLLFFFLFCLPFMWTRQCLMFFRVLLLKKQLIFIVQFTLKMWSYLLGGGNVHTR